VKTDAVAGNCSLQADFFDRADTLWEQFASALSASEKGAGPLRQAGSSGTCNFLLATADQVFSHELTLAFLNRLRQWAKEKLDARHASTPQVHVYVSGCRRELAPDAIPAHWHYLYSLTRSKPPRVRLLEEGGFEKGRFGIALGRVASFQLPFNHLLAHETRLAYGLDGPKRATNPAEGAILLHGYLW
jgi:hypothetical protein